MNPEENIVIGVLVERDPSAPEAMTANSMIRATSGREAATAFTTLLSAVIEVSHQVITGGISIGDVPEESRLRAINEATDFVKQITDWIGDEMRSEVLNPGSSELSQKTISDEGSGVEVEDVVEDPNAHLHNPENN